ncbi:unnamed protein product, partial [Didymodactylos carnosus]
QNDHNNLTSWQKYWLATHSFQTRRNSNQTENKSPEPVVHFVTLRDISNNPSRKNSRNSNQNFQNKESSLMDIGKHSDTDSPSQTKTDFIGSSDSEYVSSHQRDSTESMFKSATAISESFQDTSVVLDNINVEKSQSETASPLNTQRHKLPLATRSEIIISSAINIKPRIILKKDVISATTSTIIKANKLSQKIVHTRSDNANNTRLTSTPKQEKGKLQQHQQSFDELSWVSTQSRTKKAVKPTSSTNTKKPRSLIAKSKHPISVFIPTSNIKAKAKPVTEKVNKSQHEKENWTLPYVGERYDPPAPCVSPSVSEHSSSVMYMSEHAT